MEARRRLVPLKCYCTEEERKDIERQAEIAGMSVSEYLRKAGMGTPIKNRVDQQAVKTLGKVNADLGRAGGLLKMLLKNDEKLIGARIDAVIPELRLAFAFSQKGTDREAKVAEVLHFLCKAKRIQLFVIRQKDPIALATEIKQAFAKANLFINSDSQRDVAHLRKRYFAQKNDGN